MFLNLLDVDISIEHLSLNFDKLENIHYGTPLFISVTTISYRASKKVARRKGNNEKSRRHYISNQKRWYGYYNAKLAR